MGIANELIAKDEEHLLSFNTVETENKTKGRKNKKANGVHKYMKSYLKMYNWQDREKLIVDYTQNKINPETNLPINKMKQRYMFIQNNFDAFVEFLKLKTKKKVINMSYNRNNWTAEEDALLKTKISESKISKGAEIASVKLGRSKSACVARYYWLVKNFKPVNITAPVVRVKETVDSKINTIEFDIKSANLDLGRGKLIITY